MSPGVSQDDYWRVLAFPSLGDIPDPGIKRVTPAWQADSLPQSHQGSPHVIMEADKGQVSIPEWVGRLMV